MRRHLEIPIAGTLFFGKPLCYNSPLLNGAETNTTLFLSARSFPANRSGLNSSTERRQIFLPSIATTKLYEAIYIVNPDLGEEQVAAITGRYKQLIETNGGTVQKIDVWERRKLAYEIKGKTEGIYVVMHFTGEPKVETELRRIFQISEDQIRFMIVKPEEDIPAAPAAAEPARPAAVAAAPVAPAPATAADAVEEPAPVEAPAEPVVEETVEAEPIAA
jgi:small subunit ribosomal protein S6